MKMKKAYIRVINLDIFPSAIAGLADFSQKPH